eukprot:6163499-Prymnesium_polylepis.1
MAEVLGQIPRSATRVSHEGSQACRPQGDLEPKDKNVGRVKKGLEDGELLVGQMERLGTKSIAQPVVCGKAGGDQQSNRKVELCRPHDCPEAVHFEQVDDLAAQGCHRKPLETCAGVAQQPASAARRLIGTRCTTTAAKPKPVAAQPRQQVGEAVPSRPPQAGTAGAIWERGAPTPYSTRRRQQPAGKRQVQPAGSRRHADFSGSAMTTTRMQPLPSPRVGQAAAVVGPGQGAPIH